MAGLITVRLHRNDAQPWGFRLQGGKDFGTPLLIQKVNGGSLAEKAGLQVADAVIKVNGQDVYNLRHKDAQDSIVKAGNSMEIVLSRSPGGTWKPNVMPVGNVPAPSPVRGAPAAVTKTSLAYKGPPAANIPGYNSPAKPFSPQFNGVGVDPSTVRSITSKQYNNPVGLYSDQTIAETLSAQAEVLAGGAIGVNFMKNEKTKFDASHSEVLKMVQEIDAEPKTPEPSWPASVQPTSPTRNVCRQIFSKLAEEPVPSGGMSAPLAPAGPTSPQPGTMAPLPFHPPPSKMAPQKPSGAPPQFSAPAPSVTSSPAKPFNSVQFVPPKAPAPPPAFAPATAPYSSAPAPPSSFPKTLPGYTPFNANPRPFSTVIH